MSAVPLASPWENPVEDSRALARQIVGYSVVVRKSDQSINPESLLWLGLLVAMIWFFFWRVDARVQLSQDRASTRATALAAGISPYDVGGLGKLTIDGTVTPTLDPIQDAYRLFGLTLTAGAPTATATPSPTATATPTQIMKRDKVFMKLSFYDPMIGQYYPDIADVNCANWSREQKTCLSTMADGTPFAKYYGEAIACPPPFQNGDVLEVVYPVQLQGLWTCRDRGWAIQNGYVDFLLRYPDMVWTGTDLNRFPWSSTVQAYWIHP